MEYIVIGICLIAIVAIGARIFFKPKSKATVTPTVSVSPKEDEELSLSAPQGESAHDWVIQVEMLPAEAISEEGSLVEITDSKVLARVNNLIPNLVQAGNAVNNAVQAVEAQGEVLYRAIIPAGAKLTNSREMEGAVRGFYRGADGIQGHANLVVVEAQKGSAVVANTAAAAMGVASMVVGQYYMTQINAELGQISDGISKISDFQDNEYRSRVFSLVSHVKTIAEFQVEILENDELRLSKIAQLDSLEEECTKLLGQANLTLAGFAKKTDLDFEAYEKELQEAQNWYIYQNTLMKLERSMPLRIRTADNIRFKKSTSAIISFQIRSTSSVIFEVYARPKARPVSVAAFLLPSVIKPTCTIKPLFLLTIVRGTPVAWVISSNDSAVPSFVFAYAWNSLISSSYDEHGSLKVSAIFYSSNSFI